MASASTLDDPAFKAGQPIIAQVVTALTNGTSVLVTGLAGTATLLDEVASLLAASRMRVLRVQPPYQLTAFMQQVAPSIPEADDSLLESAYNALTVLDAAYDRNVLLVEDAHLLPGVTLRYIETTLCAGSTLCVVLAGSPSILNTLVSDGLGGLRKRLSLHLSLPASAPVMPLTAAAPQASSDWMDKPARVQAGPDAVGIPFPAAGVRSDMTAFGKGRCDTFSEETASRSSADRHSRSSNLAWCLTGIFGTACAGMIALQLTGRLRGEGRSPGVRSSFAGIQSQPTGMVAPSNAHPETAPAPASNASGAGAAAPKLTEIMVTASVAEPEVVEFPAVVFRMGSNEDSSEKPPHVVALAPFILAKKATTVREWGQCVLAKACTYVPKGKPDEPVTNVSWDDARQYVAWLSTATMQPYRLPTEAEWEYAARAGAETRYSWGNAMLPGKTSCKGCGEPVSLQNPPRVDAFPPNGFGLYGMGGGVAEWVADCWHRNYQGATHNGSTAWDSPECRERVLRGGSWMDEASALQVSSRGYYDDSVRYPTHGFRVARSR